MQHTLKKLMSLTWDSISGADVKQLLQGQKQFRPFLSYQQSWMKHHYPDDTLSLQKDVWGYLHQYMLPLIIQHASSYHLQGIQKLQLDTATKPDFHVLQDLFFKHSNGFEIQPVSGEIAPIEYFTLIQNKKFPCVGEMRTHEELFCANEPDFWHEVIGHIAPLCSQVVQEFYLKIAEFVLSADSLATLKRHIAIAWTLTEYGFLMQAGKAKMFGAALVGSHLANMRYINGMINIEPAHRHTIIESGFASETTPIARDENGKFRFFCMDNLDISTLFTE